MKRICSMVVGGRSDVSKRVSQSIIKHYQLQSTPNSLWTMAVIALLAMAMGVSSCRGVDRPVEPPTPEPTPTPKQEEKKNEKEDPEEVQIPIAIEVYQKVGKQLTKLEPSEPNGTDYPLGVVSGAGTYKEGEKVTIKAEIKDFLSQTLVAVYEKEGKGDYTEERGAINVTTTDQPLFIKEKEVRAELSFLAKDTMTFVAVFEEYQPEPLKITHINSHDYWVQKNREATAYIKPKVVRLHTWDEMKQKTNYFGMVTNLDETLVKREVYQYSKALFDFKLPNPFYAKDYAKEWWDTKGDYNKMNRYAYALTTLDGEIVEVYPPCYAFENVFTKALNYITAPEGTYRVVILVNSPEDRNIWYQLPRISVFSKADAYYGEKLGWKEHYPLPAGQDWYKDSDIIYVKNREQNSITTPTWDEVEIKGMGNPHAKYRDVNITIKVTNVTNQRLEGSVVLTEEYSKWFHEEGQILMKLRMQQVVKDEGHDFYDMYDYYCMALDEIHVKLLPNETKLITYEVRNHIWYLPIEKGRDMFYHDRSHWAASSINVGDHTDFYWSQGGQHTFMPKGGEREMAKMKELDWGSLNAKYVFFYYRKAHGVPINQCAWNVLYPNNPKIFGHSLGRNAIVL